MRRPHAIHWAALLICGLLHSAAAIEATASEPTQLDVFTSGEGGYALYRIPGIVATESGVLVAYCEARKSAYGDWGATDVLLRRSSDGGQTWSPPRKLVEPPPGTRKNPVAIAQKLGKEGEITVNNPLAIAARRGSRPAIHFLHCIENGALYYQKSEDDGQTFSEPAEITSAFEAFRPAYDWKVFAIGPGHGIELRSGRLIVPVWLSTGEGGHGHRPSCVSVVYSDDEGGTWKPGDIVCAHPDPVNPSESMAVELEDGRVMLNIRHEGQQRRRAVAISRNGATDWSDLRYDDALPEPVCMASLVRLPAASADDESRLLFCNPHNPKDSQRRNLAIKLSDDDGRTWPIMKTLEPGVAGYSDLAIGPKRQIYCFYERGAAGDSQFRVKSLCLAECSLDWLTGE